MADDSAPISVDPEQLDAVRRLRPFRLAAPPLQVPSLSSVGVGPLLPSGLPPLGPHALTVAPESAPATPTERLGPSSLGGGTPASIPVTMPNANDPQYRPLRGLSALGAVLSQFAGIPTKAGLEPLPGVQRMGQEALAAPQQRYARDVAAAKGNIEAQTAESEGKLRTAQTGLTEVEAEAKRKEMGLPKPVSNEEVPATGPNNEQLKIIGSQMGGKLVYSVAGGPAPTENSPITAQGALDEYIKGLTPATPTPIQPSGGLTAPTLRAGTAPLPVTAAQPAAGWKLGEAKPADRLVAPEELQGIRESISASGIPADEKAALLKELRPNMTTAEMDKLTARADSAMGRVSAENVANQNRKAAAQTARDEKEAVRDEEAVIAFNPAGKQWEYTTRGEAKDKGYTNIGSKVTEAEADKEKSASRQFNDVQMNISRYRKAYAALPGPLSDSDLNNMTAIQSLMQKLEKPGEGGFVSTLSAGYVPALANSAQRQSLSKAWGQLSKPARDVMVGYLRAMGSVPAYNRALNNIGRTSDITMQIEMNNLPLPTTGYGTAKDQLDAFQENIDVASQGLIKFPGLDQPKDIRQNIEGAQGAGAQVTMKAPNGQTRQVPADQVDHYKSLGAVVVNQ